MENGKTMNDLPSVAPKNGLVISLSPEITSSASRTLIIPADEFRWQFARSGGPGGQNVNKVATKAILRWHPRASPMLPNDMLQRLLTLSRHWQTQEGELVITSQRHRQQQRNVEDCLQKLHDLLVNAARRPKVRKKTKPSRGSKERRLATKRHQSMRKERRKMRDE